MSGKGAGVGESEGKGDILFKHDIRNIQTTLKNNASLGNFSVCATTLINKRKLKWKAYMYTRQ